MGWRGIPFVLGETVARIGSVHLLHELVPRNLGDDGRCGDGDAQGIAVHDGFVRQASLGQGHRINEQQVGTRVKLPDGMHHRPSCGLHNAQRVYLVWSNDTYPVADGHLAQAGMEAPASFRGEELAISYAFGPRGVWL